MTFEEFCNGRPYSSQLRQDLFAAYVCREKRDLWFVEVGAADGIRSNTLLLEREYGWQGLLVEPFTHWHEALRKNRPQSRIDERAAWSVSGKVMDFYATTNNPEFAALCQCSTDHHNEMRRQAPVVQVVTASLNELLLQHEIPSDFAYLSIDTEGSELEILAAFDWDRYRPTVITVEHNYQAAARDGLGKLLTGLGYAHECEHLSQWDDWYVTRRTP